MLVIDAFPDVEQTRQVKEHALIAKAFGINQLIVAVSGMDKKAVNYSEKSFNLVRDSTMKSLQRIGYKKDQVTFIAVSG